jgi:glycosyltransferase involved in cell wall biosynthesis
VEQPEDPRATADGADRALGAGNGAAISVCIPFYAGRDYLRRAVESVLAQDLVAWELVVADDGGPEADVEGLVRGYGDSRIRYVRNPQNLGMVGNWNRCLDVATGDLVTLLHADDELRPGYCGLMVRAAAGQPQAVAFFCRATIIGPGQGERFSFPDFVKRFLAPGPDRRQVLRGESALRAILRGNFIMCPTLCYRKSRLAGRRFSPRWKFVQDMDLIARLLLEGETLVGLPETAFAYRRHDENATSAYTENLFRFEEESLLYEELGRAALARGWRRAARVAAGKWIVKLNLGYCALRDACRLRLGPSLRKTARLVRMLEARTSCGRG